jgi:hypothetical protein
MKKYSLVFIIIFAVMVYLLFFSQKGVKPPEEYRLNVTHVSDQDESQKYGKRVGGYCYLASTTMMLKSFDPAIEFWQLVIARGNTTSFSFYFPKGNESEIKEGFAGGGTELALKAIKNMGYQPHVRLQFLPIFNKNNGWVKLATELGGDVKTYWFMPPMNEYKSVIASGIPLVAAGSPCWQDYNVIEGYTKDKLFAVVPDPNDEGKTDPKMSCSMGLGLQYEVFWATPLDKQMRHPEILADMKLYSKDVPEKLLMYANYLEKGSSIVDFEIERLYLARLLAAKYLEERELKELAAGYKRSASLLEELTQFAPFDANKHKEKIISNMRLLGENEKDLIDEWNKTDI